MGDSLKDLRVELGKQGADGFIIPSQDAYMNEYVPPTYRRLEWLTGFTGSAGIAVVLHKKAVFFTDGRYTLQARKQLNGKFKIINNSEKPTVEWLKKNCSAGQVICYDPKLHSEAGFRKYKEAAAQAGFSLSPTRNLIDKIWVGRPQLKPQKILMHSIKYTGQSFDNKKKNIIKEMANKNIDAVIVTAPDSICWLLNIRGSDVVHTPLVLGYAVLFRTGQLVFYSERKRYDDDFKKYLGSNGQAKPMDSLEGDLVKLKGLRIQLDPNNASTWFFDCLRYAGADIVEAEDPCLLPKARKNNKEINGMRKAHLRDGVALVKFLYWLEREAPSGNISEFSAAKKLEEIRREGELFKDVSFDTISAFGANGAIVHYHVTSKSNARLKPNGLYLLDSGAQYMDGTTDVTRTIAIGNSAKEQRENFTRVLKGHIAIASAAFPKGTRGCDLDILARHALWQVGADYDHGTGHGVGSYLSVHEGPQGISRRNSVELVPGMVLSNEPGYYEEKKYGIRIESLVLVNEDKKLSKDKPFLSFETLTLAPIDTNLIEVSMLSKGEIDWLNDYHAEVCSKLSPLLDAETKKWLAEKTKPLGAGPELP